MATGKKAFEGKTTASVMAKILEVDPPPMMSLQPMTPPMLDRVVKKCLAKEPDDRWHSAKDLCDELKWIAGGSSQITSMPADAPKGIHSLLRGALLWGSALALLAAMIGLIVWSLRPPSSPQPVSRFTITLPPGQRLAGPDYSAVALSPDGMHLAYIANQGSIQQLYLRPMDSLESRAIPCTDGAQEPFFSPDGQWLGFFADGKLKKVSVNGGTAQSLADAPAPRGASWGSQGTIAFAPFTAGPLQQVPYSGGAMQSLTHIEKGENSNRWPDFLPGGKAVLYAAGITNTWAQGQVAVLLLTTGERRNLIKAGMYPRYAASGHLIYEQGGTLMAVPFDLQSLTVSGSAIPVADDVMQSPNGSVQYSLSATGTLIYVPAGGVQAAQRRLVLVSRNGTEQSVGAPAHAYYSPRLSPDGKRVALAVAEQDGQVLLYDFSRETLTRLTFEGTSNLVPTWTPDGKRIAFVSDMKGPQNIFWQMADGSGGLERLTTSESGDFPGSWSPDSQLLSYVEVNPNTGYDIWVLRMSDRKAEPFLRTPSDEVQPRFSPDGRWLAYVSNESGRYEVYVQSYPGPGGKWQISTDGGTEAVWNPNGRELFYRSGGKMMAVDIATQPGFSAGKPKMLFEESYVVAAGITPNYDISPDGQRFLMLKPVEQAQMSPPQINVVLNWFEELKRRVPVGAK